MEKTNKIGAEIFANAVKNSSESNTITGNWNGIDVVIKRTLSLKDMLTFVDNVVKTCFSESDGIYMPEVKDFAIKKCILEMYANFELPSNVEESYSLIYESNIIDFVICNINNSQLREIVQSAEEKMEHLAQANIEMVNRQMNELYAAFDNLQKQIAGAFAGVDANDVNKLVGAISNGQIDEEKMVKAFLNERNSDNKVVPMPHTGE